MSDLVTRWREDARRHEQLAKHYDREGRAWLAIMTFRAADVYRLCALELEQDQQDQAERER